MDTTLQSQSEEPVFPLNAAGEKSELMKLFEMQVNDAYWAYHDLLRAIFDSEGEAEA